MKTHFEAVECSKNLVIEVIDSYKAYEGSKGHKWEETTPEACRKLPSPINFPIPNGDNICPFCFGELLAKLGRVTIVTVQTDKEVSHVVK